MDSGMIWGEEHHLVKKLYINVTNTTEIRKLIFSAKLPFTLINPKLIVDPFQLSVAVTKALFNVKEGKMKTRSLPTEIIYCLSPSKNITESLNQFSAQDGDREILVIGEAALFPKVGEQIEGDEVGLEALSTLTDVPLVKTVYAVTEEELATGSLGDAVVSRMASKEFTTGGGGAVGGVDKSNNNSTS